MKNILREATDRKADSNARRKRRKDLLRLQIIRLLQVTRFFFHMKEFFEAYLLQKICNFWLNKRTDLDPYHCNYLQLKLSFKVATFREVLPCCGCIELEGGLCSALTEFIDAVRQSLEADQVSFIFPALQLNLLWK